MSRPLIGVTTSIAGGRTMWLFNRLALARSGARAVRITADSPYPIEKLDGLVIGGGDDLNAELYGGKINPDIRIDPERDALERRVLDWAERLRLPVLGICRGAQMINVHRGGSLHTDIYEVYEQAPKLRTVLPRKTVTIAEGSRLRALLGAGEVRVNALHHQSIDRPGRGLTPVAHDRYGIVQGIEGGPAEHAGFLFGVQWHPEFLVADRRSLGLFRALAAAAAGRTAPAPAPPPRGAEARR